MERIYQLESQIDELREAILRSRRLIVVGRVGAYFGPGLLVCSMLGLPSFTSVWMIAGITLALGGLVLMGSSKASTEQLERLLRRTEGERNAAIDALELVRPEGGVN